MEEHGSDIGFGQAFKNRNKDIVKVANFASFKKANDLVPYEIYKIFRGMGPWEKYLNVPQLSTIILNLEI